MKKLLFLAFLLFSNSVYAASGAAIPSTGSVSISGSSTIVQPTHDNLNANANLQVGDTDVGPANKVPATVDGTVDAVQSGTWDIGTLTDITNVVSVDDNSSSLTVDGTVDAVQSGAWDIGTLTSITNDVSIDDGGNTITIDGAISILGDSTVIQSIHDNLNGNANLQIGDVDVGVGNPVPVSDNSGSLTVDGTVSATQSGTWDIGTLTDITNVVSVDDNAGSLTVDGTVAATQSGTWTVDSITNTVSVDDDGSSLTVDGTLTVGSLSITGDSTVIQPTHDSLNANANLQIGDVDVGVGNPVPVSDNGGSLTVDGTVAVSGTVPVSLAGTQAVSAEQSGVWDIGTLTDITNVVSVDDNAGSLTVDGTVAATQSGTWTVDSITNVVSVDDNAGSLTVDGTVDVGTLTSITNDVSIDDGGNVISVDDGAGSLTIDGSVTVLNDATVKQATHDNLNGNMTIQVADADASASNPVPTIQAALSSASFSPSNFVNLGADVTATIKGSAGNVFSLAVYNDNVATRYFQLFDAVTGPSGGESPDVVPIQIPPESQTVIDQGFFTQAGIRFSTGVSYGISTTRNTFTAATASDHSVGVTYK